VLVAGEARHVDPELADQRLRGPVLDPVQRAHELGGELKRARGPGVCTGVIGVPGGLGLRGNVRLDRRAERVDLGVEEVDVTQDPADQQRVLVAEADALERLDKRRLLDAQAALRETRERRGIALTADQRLEHQPA
jgi:hypothetical protein